MIADLQALAGTERQPVGGYMAFVTCGGAAQAKAARVVSRHRSFAAAQGAARKMNRFHPWLRLQAEHAEDFVVMGGRP